MRKKAIFNWSGGKDSSIALMKVLSEQEYAIESLLTSVNKQYQRISMHGVRVDLLKEQADRLNIPLCIFEVPEMPTMEAYNQAMHDIMGKFKKQDIHHSIFGDIFLEDLKDYRVKQLAKVDMEGVFPIWKQSTNQLVEDFIQAGFKAITVCVHDKFLDQSFVGREIDQFFLNDLPDNVDPCGENGEFHSFVYDGPIFSSPINIKKGEIVYKKYQAPKVDKKDDDCYANHDQGVHEDGFWYCDLLPI